MKMSSILKSNLLLIKSRAFNTFPYAWTSATGALMASHGSPPMLQFFLVVLSVFLMALSVYIYNDLVDADMDKLNPEKKNRPFTSGKVTKQQAMRFIYVTSLIAVTSSLFVSIQTGLLCIIWLALFLAYSNPHIYLKRRMLLKEGTPAMGYLLAIIMGAVSAGPISPNVVFGAIFWGSLIFVSIPAFRDTTDLEEDTKFGIKSLASIMSWKHRIEMTLLFFLATMTLTPLTYVYFGFNVIFPIVMIAMGLVILRYMFPLLNGLDEKKFSQLIRAGSVYILTVSASMVIGSLPLPF